MVIFQYSFLMVAQSYNWPCVPFDQQHSINGTFCECRTNSNGEIDHFHDGIDIGLAEGNPVYSVIDGTVTSIGTPEDYGSNCWVRVGRYAYVHVIPNTSLNVGDNIQAFVTVLGWTNDGNHIHFKDGYPGSERNAIRQNDGIGPLVDQFPPHIDWVRFYQDNSTVEFSNNRVFGLVDIVCDVAEQSDNGAYGDNNGIYTIGYEILNAAGEVVFGPHIPFTFDYIPSTDNYITNVFFNGSDNGTHLYIVTNNLSSNSSINVSDLESGFYITRIIAYDPYMNADTVEVSFEVVEQDLIPPAAPQILHIISENNGFYLKWKNNTEEDLLGYRLYFSYDMENWFNNHDESILTADLNEFHAASFSNNTGYFKMTAVDNAPFPNESDDSDIFVFRKNQGAGGLNLIATYESEETQYFSTIGQLADEFDLAVQSIHQSVFTDTSFVITNEFVPVILTGRQITAINENIFQYFDENPFCILGTKAIATLHSTTAGSAYLDSLGIQLIETQPIPEIIYGIQPPFLGMTFDELNQNAIFDSINSFSLQTNNDLSPVLLDNNGKILTVVSSGNQPWLISTVPFELLNTNDQRQYFIQIFNFLADFNLANHNEIKLYPKEFSFRFYPNPFNISGKLTINGSAGNYHLKLFNILGQVVWNQNVVINHLNNFNIQLPESITDPLTSGQYFLMLSDEQNQSFTQKIMLIK